jgi:4-hydroxy-4-methyl-2-oxoglutarate aldolase
MKTVVVRNVPRAGAETIAALGKAGVSTVHEAMGRVQLMKPYLRPVYPGAAIAGSAITVLAQPGDNWMIHVAIEHCRPGDVLVVGLTADNTDGHFGELLATSLKAHGVIGLVIDAGCRDARALTEMRFPVWSRAISAKGTVKATLGAVNLPVVCAGVNVNAGDVIVADDDGVVVVPRKEAAEVAELAAKRMEREDKLRLRLEKKELGLDINAMRPQLEKLGLVYVDSIEDVDKL